LPIRAIHPTLPQSDRSSRSPRPTAGSTWTHRRRSHNRRKNRAQATADTKLTRTSIRYLQEEVGGRVIKKPVITYRPAYTAALTVRKSGPEVDKDGTTQREIEELWTAVNKLLEEKLP
jgi:hypothetical protein